MELSATLVTLFGFTEGLHQSDVMYGPTSCSYKLTEVALCGRMVNRVIFVPVSMKDAYIAPKGYEYVLTIEAEEGDFDIYADWR